MMEKLAEYRLVYLQPTPEDGERVCVAILFIENNRPTLSFDTTLKRARCLGESLDLDSLRSLLHFASHALTRDANPVTWLASTLGTQFSISEPRQVRNPISESIRVMLLERFVFKRQQRMESNAYEQEFGGKLRQFALRNKDRPDLRIIVGAEPENVTGQSLRRVIKPIALAITSERKTLLIDGVDFNLLSPKRAKQIEIYTVYEQSFALRGYSKRDRFNHSPQ